ncbi:hypothetical protein HDV05_003168 [Chytridiales sp. JEL 0842]|nr:hypothetical protein HDV05_003168 [Chytridiales sp. JEL 0842]
MGGSDSPFFITAYRNPDCTDVFYQGPIDTECHSIHDFARCITGKYFILTNVCPFSFKNNPDLVKAAIAENLVGNKNYNCTTTSPADKTCVIAMPTIENSLMGIAGDYVSFQSQAKSAAAPSHNSFVPLQVLTSLLLLYVPPTQYRAK